MMSVEVDVLWQGEITDVRSDVRNISTFGLYSTRPAFHHLGLLTLAPALLFSRLVN